MLMTGRQPAPPTGVRTTCPYCGVGCGIVATPRCGGQADIAGDQDHPANFGRLCSKGSALRETLGLHRRLLHPEIGGQRVSWDSALDKIAGQFASAVARHGPDAVALYVSGQLLTEDYYVANKLMKGFIGSANIDTNSRLCMSSSVAGHRRAFGSDTVPGRYEDLEEADLVVLVGSNLAWCHPVLFQRIQAARERRPSIKLVVIDPRGTVTAEAADLHLALAPDADVALFNGLFGWLADHGCIDHAYVAAHTEGLDGALRAARAGDLETVGAQTGLARDDLRRFFDLFAATERVVTVYSQGVNQSVRGTDKVNAILNCHLATGRIGRRGMGPFSVTGQPNAMGGREVGGLANQLACHMDLENPEHRALVKRFWRSPAVASRPGLKAVDLFQAVDQGRVKALWIMATNPVDSLPDADRVRSALKACPFVAVSEVTRHTDTAAVADVLLPALAWGEKDGTVTNSERRISRQRSFLPPPGEARPDWWIVAEVAGRMGYADAFPYTAPSQIFREHAALSAADNGGSRAFDIGALAAMSDREYDDLEPVCWPLPAVGTGHARFFSRGGFHTPSGRARLVPTGQPVPRSPTTTAFPLVLNTGRVRDHWHMMTRTGESPRLAQHVAEPFVEVHPRDAEAFGLGPAGLAVVESVRGSMLARVLVTPRQQPGSVFVPMHWNDQFARSARVDTLVAPATDPVSGQPGSKYTAVRVGPYEAAWFGFAVLSHRPNWPEADYVAVAPTRTGWRMELAHDACPDDWDDLARGLLDDGSAVPGAPSRFIAYRDAAANRHRFALCRGDRVVGALFLAPEPVSVSRAWAVSSMDDDRAGLGAGLRLLAGRGGGDRPDPGAIVCSCFDVGMNDILRAATEGGCDSLDAIGGALKAGTNCGTCRLEIRGILEHAGLKEAV